MYTKIHLCDLHIHYIGTMAYILNLAAIFVLLTFMCAIISAGPMDLF